MFNPEPIGSEPSLSIIFQYAPKISQIVQNMDPFFSHSKSWIIMISHNEPFLTILNHQLSASAHHQLPTLTTIFVG